MHYLAETIVCIRFAQLQVVDLLCCFYHLTFFTNYLNLQFMAHSAVWGHSPTQGQDINSKKLMIKMLSKSGLKRCTKLGQANSNDKRKVTLSLMLHFLGISGFNMGDVISWKY